LYEFPVKVQGYGEKGTGIWGKVQKYGERYRDMGKNEPVPAKVKVFLLTYFTPLRMLLYYNSCSLR
jgi:hypothetical protein